MATLIRFCVYLSLCIAVFSLGTVVVNGDSVPVPVLAPYRETPSFTTLRGFLPETNVSKEKAAAVPTPLQLPPFVLHDVPFVSQAPFGEWSDPRQEYGCEETSLIMAWHWRTGEKLSRAKAKQEIIAMSRWEEKNFGEYRNTSTEDTARLFREFYQTDGIEMVEPVTLEGIKKEIAAGNLVIVPVHGRKLYNPYFTPPGPIEHMIIVIGYNDATQEFIVHDPGTRRGANFRYGYGALFNALQDYPTGFGEPIEVVRSAMLVVKK